MLALLRLNFIQPRHLDCLEHFCLSNPKTCPSEDAGRCMYVYKLLICQASRCAPQDVLQAGFIKQVCASLSQIQKGPVLVYCALLAVSQMVLDFGESAHCGRLESRG